jgi:hypothetical protein
VAKMAIEINNESAATLIQSVTVHNFPVGSMPSVPVVSRFFCEAMALSRSTLSQFFIGVQPAQANAGQCVITCP